MDKEELEIYNRAVQYYASKGENYTILNHGPQHAKIIFINMFNNAQKHVRIAAEHMCDNDVVDTPEYIEAVNKFLNQPGSQLDILVTSIPKEVVEKKENCFLRFLSNHTAYKAGRVHIKDLEGKHFYIKNSNSNERTYINFSTADSKIYRYENDIEEKTAICNFGDKEKTEQYEKLFDQVFSKIKDNIDLNSLLKAG